jgi:hypothetical protein
LLPFFAKASSEIVEGAKTKASARTTAVDTSYVLLAFILVNYITIFQYILAILKFYVNKFQFVLTKKSSRTFVPRKNMRCMYRLSTDNCYFGFVN